MKDTCWQLIRLRDRSGRGEQRRWRTPSSTSSSSGRPILNQPLAEEAGPTQHNSAGALFSYQRLFAYTIREGLELVRDSIRLMFALFGTTILKVAFGLGISTDVNNLTFAVLDNDKTPESRPISKSSEVHDTSSRSLSLPMAQILTKGMGASISASRSRQSLASASNSGHLPCVGLDRRRHAAPSGNNPGQSAKHAPALSGRSDYQDNAQHRPAARHHRDQVQVQSGLR